MTEKTRIIATFLVFFGVGLVGFCLGVDGPFALDDYHNLSPSSRYGGVHDLSTLFHFLFGVDGNSYWRSFSRLSFLLDDNTWPSSPGLYKSTNILLHVANALLVYLICFTVFKLLNLRDYIWLSIFAAGVWFINPMQVSTVLYVVQRMAMLAAFFMFLVIILSMKLDFKRFTLGNILLLLGMSVFGALGILSKENAILVLPLVLFFTVFLFDGFTTRLFGFYKFALYVLCSVILILFIRKVVIDLPYYEFRTFSLWDRISVQAYVLFKYIYFWFFPWSDGLGLYHDNIEYIVENKGSWFFAPLWLIHFSIIWGAIKYRNRYVLAFIGVCWFYISHIIESTFLSLELMYEHRNYFPSLGLVFVTCEFLLIIRKYVVTQLPFLFVAILSIYVGLLSIFLVKRSLIWSDENMMYSKWAYENPDSLRAQLSFIGVMTKAGMYDAALNTNRQVSKTHRDIGLRIDRLSLICEAGLEPKPEDRLELADVSQYPFRTNIVHSLSVFLKGRNEQCQDDMVSGGSRLDLAETVGLIKGLVKRKPYYANYLEVMREEYIRLRDYQKAVLASEALYVAQPTSATALKAVELFLMGGDIENAALYLKYAKEKNSSLWYEDQYRNLEIENLEEIINALSTNS